MTKRRFACCSRLSGDIAGRKGLFDPLFATSAFPLCLLVTHKAQVVLSSVRNQCEGFACLEFPTVQAESGSVLDSCCTCSDTNKDSAHSLCGDDSATIMESVARQNEYILTRIIGSSSPSRIVGGDMRRASSCFKIIGAYDTGAKQTHWAFQHL
jgi:hypothetical protein